MNTSGEAAEQIFRITLEGIEFAAKISGATAKTVANAIAFLAKELSENKNSFGKTRLANMLKSGKELRIFSVETKDLEAFMNGAKSYGIRYCGVRDKQIADGMNDFFVYAEDAPKINRLIERLKLSSVNPEQVKEEIRKEQKTKQEENTEEAPANDTQSLLDQILHPKQEADRPEEENPTMAGPEKGTPSAPLSESIGSISEGRDRPSVIGKIDKIKEDLKKRDPQKSRQPQGQQNNRPQPKNLKAKERN